MNSEATETAAGPARSSKGPIEAQSGRILGQLESITAPGQLCQESHLSAVFEPNRADLLAVRQPLDTSALASTVATPAQGLERPNGAQSGEILGHYQPNTALGKFEQEGHLGADFQPLRAVEPDFEAARRPVETFAPAHTAAEGLQSNLGLVGARSGQDLAHSGGVQGFPSREKIGRAHV